MMRRCTIQSIGYAIPLFWQREPFFGNMRQNVMLAIRGVFSYSFIVLNYTSIRLIPFGDATSISLSAPMFTSVMAFFFLGEPFTCVQFVCIVCCLGGVTLITKPDFIVQTLDLEQAGMVKQMIPHAQQIAGCTCAFMSAIFLAFCYILVRRLKTLNVWIVLFWFSFGSLVCSLIHLSWLYLATQDPTVRWPVNTYEWTCITVSALAGLTGQLILNMALKIEDAGPISLARTGDILISFLVQALILHNEPIDVLSLLGATSILLSISMTALQRWVVDGQNPPAILRSLCCHPASNQRKKSRQLSLRKSITCNPNSAPVVQVLCPPSSKKEETN